MSPRHDLEAEKLLLGACISDQRIVRDLTVTAEDFYSPIHQEIWQMITDMDRANEPIDPVTLGQRIFTAGVRGLKPDYASHLHGLVFTTAAAARHAQIVVGLARLRRVAEVGARLEQISANADVESVGAALEDARSSLDASLAREATGGGASFHEALLEAMDEWGKEITPGVPTGWADLDDAFNGGWKPGQLTIVGARPAVGKTVIAGCAAVAAAQHGVGYFSLEMSRTEAVGRMAAAARRIELGRFGRHDLTDSDWARLAELAAASQEWKLMVDNRSRLSMAQVRSTVRSWSRKFHPRLVIIDYLQILRPADERNDTRERQVNRLAEDCKLLAREFDVHVLALAQVGRGSTMRTDKRPTMSDLRESGGIEAHADNIILLHRADDRPGEIEFNIEKNRHGKTAILPMAWAPYYGQVRDLHREKA